MGRKVIIDGDIFTVDHETFGSDETDQKHFHGEAVLNQREQPAQAFSAVHRVGGEVRVEVKGTASLLSRDRVRLKGMAKMFEGDTVNSDDLDGTEPFNYILYPNTPHTFSITVRNEDEGGDYADITLYARNVRV
jgi:uncharacterized Zn-binding protein involved in type VI secretion